MEEPSRSPIASLVWHVPAINSLGFTQVSMECAPHPMGNQVVLISLDFSLGMGSKPELKTLEKEWFLGAIIALLMVIILLETLFTIDMFPGNSSKHAMWESGSHKDSLSISNEQTCSLQLSDWCTYMGMLDLAGCSQDIKHWTQLTRFSEQFRTNPAPNSQHHHQQQQQLPRTAFPGSDVGSEWLMMCLK